MVVCYRKLYRDNRSEAEKREHGLNLTQVFFVLIVRHGDTPIVKERQP